MTTRSRQTFEQIVSLPDLGIPLAEAALLLACEEYPRLSLPSYLDELDRMAESVNLHVGGATGYLDKIEGMNHVLFLDYGFRGNRTNYYDPRNSFLNEVIDRRQGIPITLSTIYIEVGRRIGLRVDGVGLPGHFIVKCYGDKDEMFLDPFNQGAVLKREDCREILRQVNPDSEQDHGRWLSRVTNRQILGRMINNLKVIYLRSGTLDKALGMVDLMVLNEPDATHLYRERGMLRLQGRQYRGAAQDFHRYLREYRDAPDRLKIEQRLRDISRIRATMN